LLTGGIAYGVHFHDSASSRIRFGHVSIISTWMLIVLAMENAVLESQQCLKKQLQVAATAQARTLPVTTEKQLPSS
jgi:hypothetical protein